MGGGVAVSAPRHAAGWRASPASTTCTHFPHRRDTGRNTAGDLDPAFWHPDSRKFEGEATRVACACAVWGPLVGGESAAPSTQNLTFDAMGELRMEYSAALIRYMLASGLNAITITLCDPKRKQAELPCVTPARRGEGELSTGPPRAAQRSVTTRRNSRAWSMFSRPSDREAERAASRPRPFSASPSGCPRLPGRSWRW